MGQDIDTREPTRDPRGENDTLSSERPTISAEKAISGSSAPATESVPTCRETKETDEKREAAYSCFTRREKWGIISLISLASIFSPISTNIYTPAIPTLADAFNVPVERINLTLTVYLVFQALSPSLWGAASDAYGRRPIFIINLVLYILSCIGTALCPTDAFWLLLLMRIVQAAGGSATIALGTGVIADISLPHERGKFVGVFQFAGTFSTAIGPVLGGVLAYTLGWRSIFWFLTIFCGVILMPIIFLLPETLRSLVGDGSIPPPMLNCTPQAYRRRRREERQAEVEGRIPVLVDRPPRVPFRPLASLILLFTPDLGMIFFWSAIGYALWYAVITVFSTLLKDKYGLNDIVIGVCYIPNGIGTGVSALIVGRFMDKAYHKEKERVGGDHRNRPDDFRLERTRFVFFPYQASVTIAATLILGWTMQVKANLAVPIVFSFFVGVGTSFLATTSIYGIDLYPKQGGAVTASFNLIRCASAAVSVAIIQVIVRHLGAGWGFVLLSGVWLVCSPLPILVARYGPLWRKRRSTKIEQALANTPVTQTITPSLPTSKGPPVAGT